MQAQSFARKLLESIAVGMGKPTSTVDGIIKSLEDNWFDTQEALQTMCDQDYDALKIPLRIRQLIAEHLAMGANTPKQDNWQLLIIKLAEQINNQQQFERTLNMLQKMVNMVIDNPLNPQYQSISLTSKSLQTHILPFSNAMQILAELGWKQSNDAISTTYNMNQLDHWQAFSNTVDLLFKRQPEAFNPYQANFGSRSGISNADIAHQEGYDVFSFYDQLERLKSKRYDIMKPIPKRDMRLFRAHNNLSMAQMQQQISGMDDYEEIEPSKDAAFIAYLKQIALSLEEQQFASKRKKEFEELFNKPIYSETLIRVKLPFDLMFEAKFSPLEPLQALINLIRSEVLVNSSINFYLYTTPPVVKQVAKHMNVSFDDSESVPNGLYYFALEDGQPQYTVDQLIKGSLLNSIISIK